MFVNRTLISLYLRSFFFSYLFVEKEKNRHEGTFTFRDICKFGQGSEAGTGADAGIGTGTSTRGKNFAITVQTLVVFSG